ncbi:hypothetical protein niasHS_010080 [Heterodera schachtii]|uniref:BTB domain-containing protein n=1 Tax=Heterodera schachtii TaxID=97005 RepID=A0ABD2J0A2_HETSC
MFRIQIICSGRIHRQISKDSASAIPRKQNMTSVLDISIAFEDQEDSDVNLVDCSRELAISAHGNFNELRLSGKMCDIEIETEGIKFKAHKVILAATVPYFMKMFGSEMVEAHSDSVQLNTIDAEIMGLILDFIYTGRIKFTSRNMERLLKAADYLQLSVLSNRCSEILKAHITEENVFSIRKFAVLYNARQAVLDTESFIQRFFESVSKSEEFLQLDFQTLVQTLDWDNLHVGSEECVFEALARWLDFDPLNRHTFAPRLLATIRMPFLRPAFIVDVVSNHPLLHSSMECRDLIDEAKNFHLVPERRSQFSTPFKTSVRICTDMPGRIYAMGGINQLQQSPSGVEYFDPPTKKWTLGKPMLSQRTRIGVAVFDRKIYAVGGYNGTERLKKTEVFDTRTNQWETLSPMLNRRSAMCAVTLGENIFVCGGYDGNHALDSVESFDIRKNQWFVRPPMLTKRCAAATAVLKGQIYVIGGHNGVSIFDTVERFDPISQRWERVAPMQQPRCRLAATTYQNKIYAVGGYYNTEFMSTAEVYDPEMDQWSYIAPMGVCRARVSLVTNGDLLQAIGGYDGENNLSSMEIYYPSQNKWEKAAPMRIHEGGVGCAVVPLLPPSLNKFKRPMTETMLSKKSEGVTTIALEEGLIDITRADSESKPIWHDAIPLNHVVAVRQSRVKLRSGVPTGNVSSIQSANSNSLFLYYSYRRNAYAWRIRECVIKFETNADVEKWSTLLGNALTAQKHRPKRLLVFINPFGGKGHAISIWEKEVEPIFKLANIEYEVRKTERADHALEIVREFSVDQWEGIDGIVSVGGDGLFNEILSATVIRTQIEHGKNYNNIETVLERPRIRLGIIGAGSANSIVSTVHGVNDYQTAAIHVAVGNERMVDICAVYENGLLSRFSGDAISCGWLGDVLRDSESYRCLGPVRYVYSALRTSVRNPTYFGRVSFALSPSQPPLTVNSTVVDVPSSPANIPPCVGHCDICSGRIPPDEHFPFHWQANFTHVICCVIPCVSPFTPYGLAPYTGLNDGTMDLALIPKVSRFTNLQIIRKVAMYGARFIPDEYPDVKVYRVSRWKFTPEALIVPPAEDTDKAAEQGQHSGAWNLDGEILLQPSDRPLHFRLHPGLIRYFGLAEEVELEKGGSCCCC